MRFYPFQDVAEKKIKKQFYSRSVQAFIYLVISLEKYFVYTVGIV